MRVRLFPIVPAVVAAGCIPTRDNPAEPQFRPTARLVVSDWTNALQPGKTCADIAPGSFPPGSQAVTVVPIRHCLVLDARQSINLLGKAQFSFSGGTMTSAVTGTNAFVVLDQSRFAMTLNTAAYFSVTVVNRDNPVDDGSTATAFIIPTDNPPTVQANPGIVLPAGGFPWSPGSFSFTLRASAASDTVSDHPLSFCWTTTVGVPLGCSNDGTLPVALSTSAQELSVLVVSDDGKLASLPSSQLVRVETPGIWIGGTLVDPGQMSAGLGNYVGAAGDVLLAVTGAANLTAYTRSSFIAGAPVAGPTVQLIDGLFQDGPILHTFYDSARGRAWVLGVNVGAPPTGDGYRMQSLIIDPSTLELAPEGLNQGPSVSFSLGLQSQNYTPDIFAVVSSAGDGWVSQTLTNVVYGVHPDGTLFADGVTGGFSGSLTGLSARPGVPEVWATFDGPGRLVQISDAGDVVSQFPLPDNEAQGLAFIDSGRAWTWIPSAGFVLVDIARLVAGPATVAGFQNSVIVEEAVAGATLDYRDGPSFAADPVLGTCFATSVSANSTFAVSPDGTFEVLAGQQTRVTGTDSSGGIYFMNGGSLVRGTLPSTNALFLAVPGGAAVQMPSFDRGHGGIWYSQIVDPALSQLVHVDNSGARTAFFSAFSSGGVEQNVPFLNSVGAASPDGLVLWSYGEDFQGGGMPDFPGGLYSFVLTTSNGLVTASNGVAVVSGTSHTSPFLSGQTGDAYFVLPFSPVTSTADNFAWAGSRGTIALMDARVSAPVQTLAAGFPDSGSAPSRSLISNALCVVNDVAGTFTLQRITPDLAVKSLAPVAAAGLTASSSDAGHDACWVAFLNGATPTIEAYASDGTLLHSTTVATMPLDILSRSPDSVYLNVLSGTQQLQLLSFQPGILAASGSSVVANGVPALPFSP